MERRAQMGVPASKKPCSRKYVYTIPNECAMCGKYYTNDDRRVIKQGDEWVSYHQICLPPRNHNWK